MSLFDLSITTDPNFLLFELVAYLVVLIAVVTLAMGFYLWAKNTLGALGRYARRRPSSPTKVRLPQCLARIQLGAHAAVIETEKVHLLHGPRGNLCKATTIGGNEFDLRNGRKGESSPGTSSLRDDVRLLPVNPYELKQSDPESISKPEGQACTNHSIKLSTSVSQSPRQRTSYPSSTAVEDQRT